jgi:3-hydroxyacyl-CoA dehydrogenase
MFKKSKYTPCPLLVNMVEAGKLGIKNQIGFLIIQKVKKQALNNLFNVIKFESQKRSLEVPHL